MLTRSQLKDIFAGYGIRPLKRLGENYLIDANIKDKIIAAADAGKGDTVLEIGPGLGALTIDLARCGARVYAVEKDRKAALVLGELAGKEGVDLKIFHDDILKFDLKKLRCRQKVVIVGNLPYYITTPVFEWLIDNRRSVRRAVVMVQREVAARIFAKPGSKDYSAFSCFLQYFTSPAYVHTVKRTCFFPAPEVDSAIVKLDFPEKPSSVAGDEKLLFRIIRGAFNQRRKSIINSLSREAVLGLAKEKLSEALKRAGVSPAARPEDLSISDFAKIADCVNPVRNRISNGVKGVRPLLLGPGRL